MCYTWVHDKTRVKNIRIKKGKGKDIMVWSRKRHYFFFFGEEKKTLIECEYNFFFLIVWSDQALILIYFYEDMI